MGYMDLDSSYEEFVEVRDGREVLVVTEENIGLINVIPVDIIIPSHRRKKALYRLQMDMEILGELVEKGYVSDAASVPRIFWTFYPPVGRYLLAAIVHDWKLDEDHGWKAANKMFDRAMDAIGIIARRHFVILNSVRLNAWFKVKFKGETP